MFATNTALLNAAYGAATARSRSASGGRSTARPPPSPPCLGGLLIAAAGWRAIFLVNLPIAVVAGC